MRGLLDLGALQVTRLNHLRRAFAQVLRRQALLHYQTANRRWADSQGNGGFIGSDLSPFCALADSVGDDCLLIAQVANTGTGPAITPPC